MKKHLEAQAKFIVHCRIIRKDKRRGLFLDHFFKHSVKYKKLPNTKTQTENHKFKTKQNNFQRRFCLAIGQMASTRKVYTAYLFGTIIQGCHMINVKGINTLSVVTKE